MRNGLAIIGLIAIVLIIAAGAVGVLFLLNKNNPQSVLAVIPTAGPNTKQVATDIADATLTPGPAGAEQLPTLAPFIDDYKTGDEIILKNALAKKFASAGFDFRISSEVVSANAATYCAQPSFPDPRKKDLVLNPNLAEEIQKALFFVAGTRYCASYEIIGSLYGGVPQKDLQNITNMVIEPMDGGSVVDSEKRVITHNQKAKVTITARMGLLTFTDQMGNLRKRTTDDPDLILRAFISFTKKTFVGDESFFRKKMDEADNLAIDLAKWELIAPLQSDGTRSTQNLDKLHDEIVRQFNTSSLNDSNPWPYDNLLTECETAAKTAGYTGCGELKVKIIMPFKDGQYYYLQDLDSGTPLPVIPKDNLAQFKDNLYWYYTNLATNNVPNLQTPSYTHPSP
jgi:hypothetical protein